MEDFARTEDLKHPTPHSSPAPFAIFRRFRVEAGAGEGGRVERFDRRTIEPFEPFENLQNFCNFLLNFGDLSGAKDCKSCRSRKMLKNDALVAKFGVDTAENEPSKV